MLSDATLDTDAVAPFVSVDDTPDADAADPFVLQEGAKIHWGFSVDQGQSKRGFGRPLPRHPTTYMLLRLLAKWKPSMPYSLL